MIYYFFFTLMAVGLMNLFFSYKTSILGTEEGVTFGTVGIYGAVVAVTYGTSVLFHNPFWFSLYSSLYFMAIDWLLVALLRYVLLITTGLKKDWEKKLIRGCSWVAGIESILFLINPFFEISMHYVSNGNPFACYTYAPMPLYSVHLCFDYLIVLAVLGLFIYKAVTLPEVYRLPYTSVVIAILLIVGVNAVFLFMPKTGMYSNLDWSIFGYSFAIFLMYWGEFQYNRRGLLNRLKTDVFENLDQGLVLFDYEDKLVLCNLEAQQMIPGLAEKENVSLLRFLEICGIQEAANMPESAFSIQCFTQQGENTRPLRCDYRMLQDELGHNVGKLFVFTDVSMETDILTHFQNWEGFKHYYQEHPDLGIDCTIVTCDINGLTAYNQLHGTDAGDQLIKKLADSMRDSFPAKTYFVRELDANLVALIPNADSEEVSQCVHNIYEHFDWDFQYSKLEYHKEQGSLLEAISETIRGMRNKKLLDQKASHSESLTSLVRALKESDSDTEAHVTRTQLMGQKLGVRLGLSDIQLTDLSLLCILHDIGKIGVPLDILNKQGKLTPEEWAVIRAHVEKGYHIAKSSKDLAGIADCIRYHHERWDGKGYPTGISRESIPILSRIISVVDSYDAMTNDRPYRKRLPEGVARKELLQGAGNQFDPHIVSEFLQMLEESDEEYVEIPQNYSSSNNPTSERINPSTGDGENVHPIDYSRYLLNSERKIISVDEKFESLTGYTLEDVQSGELYQTSLLPEEDRAEYLVGVEKALANTQMAYFEHRLRKKDGTIIYVFCYGRYYYDSAVKEMRSEVIIANLSNTHMLQIMTDRQGELAQAQLERWEDQYRRDSMTGLFNHAAFQNDVEARLLNNNSTVVMLMLDVDHFKDYNDTRGHHAGDEFLIFLAQTLRDSLRNQDLCSRMGGDEFSAALFFKEGTSLTTIRTRIHQIFDNLTLCVKKFDDNLGISMGAVIRDENTETFNQLYQTADRALYVSKEDGRGKLTIAN